MAQGKTDDLEAFAKRIESRVRSAGGGTDGMERLICRILIGKNDALVTKLAERWVEWRYGKAKERIEHSGSVNLTGIIEKARKRAE